MLPSKVRVVLGLEVQRYVCLGFWFFLDWVLTRPRNWLRRLPHKVPTSLHPLAESFLMKKSYFFDKCVKIVVAFCIVYDFTSKEAIEDRLMWVASRSVQELSSIVFFVWHLISRVPVSSNRFPELSLGIGLIGPKPRRRISESREECL